MPDLWPMLEAAATAYGGRALGVLAILLTGSLILRYALGPLGRVLERSQVDRASVSFLISTLRTLIWVALLLAVLQQVGMETTSLLALLGAAGLAVALSLQGSLANFAAGLVVIAFRLVRLDDLIEVGDVRGRVSELLPFHVVVETADRQRVSLPNTLLMNGPVRNLSALPTRRAQWSLPVPARLGLAAVKEALRARLLADVRVLREPAPVLFVQEWTEERRTLIVQAWATTAEIVAVQQELLEELGKVLEAVRATSSG